AGVRASSSSLSTGITGLAETTAISPWWGMPPAMRSRVSRASKRSGMPRWPARLMASAIRRLRSPFTTRRRSKWRVLAPRASSTGLIPQMRFMQTLIDHKPGETPKASTAREQQHDGLARDALAAADGPQAVRALGLDGDGLQGQAQRLRDAR